MGGLAPGSVTPYQVRLDGELVWPPAGSVNPPSRIRTLDPDRPVRVCFGSCRYGTGGPDRGVDALDAYASVLRQRPDTDWPDLLLMLGDQVYADETTPATQQRIAARRGPADPPHGEAADFEEYTWLYAESWADPAVRWLLSTVPSAMIFDDHDVHDDWNTSRSWRQDMRATSWWAERITGGLMSYWIYQHLGNLSPAELAEDPTYAAVRAAAVGGADAEPVLRAFAEAADREVEGTKGARWSYWRDLGRIRLVVIDSRCGRVLDGARRSMLSEPEMRWVERRLIGDYDHLPVGTSLPWLLPPVLHAVEAWDERLCEHPVRWRVRLGERLRRGADLEHWAAFDSSFRWLARVIADLGRGGAGEGGAGRGGAGRPPAAICVLSGDVHHSYLCQADYPQPVASRIFQITCSPVHNSAPRLIRLAFRVSWGRLAERGGRLVLGRLARAPRPPLTWRRLGGPVFGNAIASLVLDGRHARLVLETSQPGPGDPGGPAGLGGPGGPVLRTVLHCDLAP